MKPFRLDQRMAADIVIASAWLVFLVIANQQASQPEVSIFSYLAFVVFFALGHGAKWEQSVSRVDSMQREACDELE